MWKCVLCIAIPLVLSSGCKKPQDEPAMQTAAAKPAEQTAAAKPAPAAPPTANEVQTTKGWWEIHRVFSLDDEPESDELRLAFNLSTRWNWDRLPEKGSARDLEVTITPEGSNQPVKTAYLAFVWVEDEDSYPSMGDVILPRESLGGATRARIHIRGSFAGRRVDDTLIFDVDKERLVAR